FGLRERRHDDVAVGGAAHEALALEPAQRLAQRRGADPELERDLLLVERAARRKLALEDAPPQLDVDGVGLAAVRQGPCGWIDCHRPVARNLHARRDRWVAP